jgi:hypothetical protein
MSWAPLRKTQKHRKPAATRFLFWPFPTANAAAQTKKTLTAQIAKEIREVRKEEVVPLRTSRHFLAPLAGKGF